MVKKFTVLLSGQAHIILDDFTTALQEGEHSKLGRLWGLMLHPIHFFVFPEEYFLSIKFLNCPKYIYSFSTIYITVDRFIGVIFHICMHVESYMSLARRACS